MIGFNNNYSPFGTQESLMPQLQQLLNGYSIPQQYQFQNPLGPSMNAGYGNQYQNLFRNMLGQGGYGQYQPDVMFGRYYAPQNNTAAVQPVVQPNQTIQEMDTRSLGWEW